MSTTEALDAVSDSVARADQLLQHYREMTALSEASDWSLLRDIVVDILHYATKFSGATSQSIVETALQLFEEEDAAAFEQEQNCGG